jgi:hypothetical protein
MDMIKVTYFALVSAVMLSFVGVASAEEPLQLTNSQLDRVTAGASSATLFAGAAAGTLLSAVGVNSFNRVIGPNAAAAANVTSIAASFTPGPGASAGAALTVLLTSP